MTENTFQKYKLVVDEWFINGFNGAAAYRKFYPKSSADAAKVKFSHLVTLGNVEKYISEKYLKAQEYAELTQEEIVKELEAFAMLDITKIITIGERKESIVIKDKNGNPRIKSLKSTGVIIKPFDQLTDLERRAIKSIKETKNGIEMTFFNKETAFEMLNRQKGIYEKDNKQKATPTIQVVDVRKKK